MKVWPLAMGVGLMAGAVTVLALPKNCTARKMASDAAEKMEDAVNQVANDLVDKITS